MRKMMFRGKRVGNNEWIVGTGVHCGETCRISGIEKYPKVHLPVIAESVGQWTGIYDKNGRMIFEGDIVRACWNTVFEVFYDDCMLQFVARTKRHSDRELNYYGESKHFEVIGNMFDNPKLLEEE